MAHYVEDGHENAHRDGRVLYASDADSESTDKYRQQNAFTERIDEGREYAKQLLFITHACTVHGIRPRINNLKLVKYLKQLQKVDEKFYHSHFY